MLTRYLWITFLSKPVQRLEEKPGLNPNWRDVAKQDWNLKRRHHSNTLLKVGARAMGQ